MGQRQRALHPWERWLRQGRILVTPGSGKSKNPTARKRAALVGNAAPGAAKL